MDLRIFSAGRPEQIYDLKPAKSISGIDLSNKKYTDQLFRYIIRASGGLDSPASGTVLAQTKGTILYEIAVKHPEIFLEPIPNRYNPSEQYLLLLGKPGVFLYVKVKQEPPVAPSVPIPVDVKEEKKTDYQTQDRRVWGPVFVFAAVAALAIAVDILFPPAAIRHAFGSP
jgi:hypothetical protein